MASPKKKSSKSLPRAGKNVVKGRKQWWTIFLAQKRIHIRINSTVPVGNNGQDLWQKTATDENIDSSEVFDGDESNVASDVNHSSGVTSTSSEESSECGLIRLEELLDVNKDEDVQPIFDGIGDFGDEFDAPTDEERA